MTNSAWGIMVIMILVIIMILMIVMMFTTHTISFSRSTNTVSFSRSPFQMITVTNQPRDPRLELLMKSAADKGGFAKGERVLLTCKEPFSWARRLTLWRDYYSKLPRDTVVLSVDAFDVVLMAPKEEILEKFHASGASLLFGYTDYCWPFECDMCVDEKHPRLYSASRKKTMYLCAGTYIGRAGYLADLLHAHPWTEDVDDQCYFATIYLQQDQTNPAMKLDEDHHIFQNTTHHVLNQGLLLHDDLDKKRPLHTMTGTRPCVFHFDSFHPSFEQLSSHYQQLQG